MNETTFSQTLRQNWHLVLVLVLAVLGSCVGLYMSFGAATPATQGLAPLAPNAALSEDQMRAILFASPSAVEASGPRETKEKQVEAHRARYDANPEDPEAGPLLRAMGNLYKQLGDYQNAIWAYQRFLERFPKNPARTSVYLELAGCFELTGDADNETRVFLEMLKNFPPDSNSYKYAEARLKMSELKVLRRDPNFSPSPGPEGTFEIETLPDGTRRYVDSETKQPIEAVTPPPEWPRRQQESEPSAADTSANARSEQEDAGAQAPEQPDAAPVQTDAPSAQPSSGS